MFWKRSRQAKVSTKEGGQEAKAEVPKPQKPKKLSPKEIVINQIEQLSPGQRLSYRLHETFGGGLGIIELNPNYPTKGKKYILSTDKIVDAKPAGKIQLVWDYNKPKDLADWIVERYGVPFNQA